MTYVNRPGVVEPVVTTTDYHDRVRWGPILAGLVIALVSQLILSAFGAAIGLTTLAGSDSPNADAGNVGTAVGIWTIISLLISLFLGSWVMARSCGPMNRNTGLLNGAILWATTLALSAWLLTSGVSGLFGIVASNAGEIINQVQPGGVDVPDPGAANATPEETRDIAGNAAKAGWSFVIGSLLSLAASLIGASTGTRVPRATTYVER